MAALLEEQQAYYEARAAEYDEWWERRGRYDLGVTRNAQWREEIRKVEAIFDQAPLVGQVGLEERVDYEETDLFGWCPQAKYNAVFLSFWISHLPSAVLDDFLLLMVSALRPGGCLSILEGQPSGSLRSSTQGTYRLDVEIERRTLNDGRTFRIVKCHETCEDLLERLRRLGLEVQAGTSGEQFLYALAFRPN